MANYAVVKNGLVENMIVWDGVTEFSVPDCELIEATSDARIGGSWDGNVFAFVEPTPTEPTAEQVARQEKLDSVRTKLSNLGLTTEEVKEAFNI
jgi:hypothetical protein